MVRDRQQRFYTRPRLRRWSIARSTMFLRSVVACRFVALWAPPLWQRDFFLVNCLLLRHFLTSERSGVEITFRCATETNPMQTVRGDLLALTNAGDFDVIIHGCNCQNTMGAGIAKSIKQQFPAAYADDLATEKGRRLPRIH